MIPARALRFLLVWTVVGYLRLGLNSTWAQSLSERLSRITGVVATPLGNTNYPAGYCMLEVRQPLDQGAPANGMFTQRVFVGLYAAEAPVVLVTEGYAADYAGLAGYQDELAAALQANVVVVEHRYFGKSVPAVPDYRWLTTQQAAGDIHAIRTALGAVFTGRWVSTGSSKGGQAALAHRMLYPNDVAATVVYGTAVKKSPTVVTSALLRPLMETECGKRLQAFQQHCFQHKDSLFPAFLSRIAVEGLEFGDLEVEAVYDYALLELPFSFWQMGGDCAGMPSLAAGADALVDYWMGVVSPRYYTLAAQQRWAPAYYMFYHELGYYEYDIAPFRKYLKQEAYPNAVFGPAGVEVVFDRGYLQAVRDFLEEPAAHAVFFIYGEHDPWALQSVVTDNKYVVPGGGHRSKLAGLPEEVRVALLGRIRRCLGE